MRAVIYKEDKSANLSILKTTDVQRFKKVSIVVSRIKLTLINLILFRNRSVESHSPFWRIMMKSSTSASSFLVYHIIQKVVAKSLPFGHPLSRMKFLRTFWLTRTVSNSCHVLFSSTSQLISLALFTQSHRWSAWVKILRKILMKQMRKEILWQSGTIGHKLDLSTTMVG